MNSSEVVKLLSERLGQTQREIRLLLKRSTEIFKKTLDEDISFTLPKLGTFETHFRQERKAYNPYYKKIIMLAPKRVVSFHPSSVLKDHIKGPKGSHDK